MVPSFERDRPPGGSPLVTPQLNGGPARRAVKNKDDGPAHHGANGAAMPTDEDDQYGHFFFNHPERGGDCRESPQLRLCEKVAHYLNLIDRPPGGSPI